MSHYRSRLRAEQALELRGKARSYQEIADTLNYRSASAARTAVRRLIVEDIKVLMLDGEHMAGSPRSSVGTRV